MPKPVRSIEIKGDVAFIPLTRGLFAIIDAVDAHLVEGRNWRAAPMQNIMYAGTNRGPKNRSIIRLHQVILNLDDGAIADHRDGDGLNCRRSNLRPATKTQNAQNSAKPKRNKSGAKGVCWHKKDQRWHSRITVNGKLKHLGIFLSFEDAKSAYEAAAKVHFGDFARLTP